MKTPSIKYLIQSVQQDWLHVMRLIQQSPEHKRLAQEAEEAFSDMENSLLAVMGCAEVLLDAENSRALGL